MLFLLLFILVRAPGKKQGFFPGALTWSYVASGFNPLKFTTKRSVIIYLIEYLLDSFTRAPYRDMENCLLFSTGFFGKTSINKFLKIYQTCHDVHLIHHIFLNNIKIFNVWKKFASQDTIWRISKYLFD